MQSDRIVSWTPATRKAGHAATENVLLIQSSQPAPCLTSCRPWLLQQGPSKSDSRLKSARNSAPPTPNPSVHDSNSARRPAVPHTSLQAKHQPRYLSVKTSCPFEMPSWKQRMLGWCGALTSCFRPTVWCSPTPGQAEPDHNKT